MLVVDTIGFNGRAKVDRYGTPSTTMLHTSSAIR
jgi:hypothetical protein